MKCTKCGKNFEAGNREDGIPNGVAFVTKKGRYTLCAECLMEMGRMGPADRERFFEELQPDPEQ